jgi:fermentation-respiration switch protein FrsA (DUF1100 family)
MAHGFSGVKEMFLPAFAERFAAAGFITLVFDFRFLGESEGEPRGQILPHEQHEDFRNAITWLARRPEVDPDRIGVWGTSYSGGHVLHLSAFDPRIRAGVAQVPAIGAWRQILASGRRAEFDQMRNLLALDRVARFETGQVSEIPVVAPPGKPSVLAVPDAYEWFQKQAADLAPPWRNAVTTESIEQMLEYDPAGAIELVAPTPLLMIVAEHDSLIPVDVARAAFERAGAPKELLVLECGHFDVYATEPWFGRASGAATRWFEDHLT